MTFRPDNNAVIWITQYGPVRMDERTVRGLLEIWSEDEELYDELRDAFEKVFGLYETGSVDLRPITVAVRMPDPGIWGSL